MKIAFFDSGIGGITVLKEAVRIMPNAEFIYFADAANIPYGTKSKEEVYALVLSAIQFIAEQNPDALVIACNTATSIAVDALRKLYPFPIFGMEPAIKPAAMNSKGKKILVTATSLTLREKKLDKLIESLNIERKLEKINLDELVTFAESFDFSSKDVCEYIKTKLDEIDLRDYDSIVLGCTHFIFYKEVFQKLVGNKITILDGNLGTINNLKKALGYLVKIDMEICSSDNFRFYSSGIEDPIERKTKLMGILYPA